MNSIFAYIHGVDLVKQFQESSAGSADGAIKQKHVRIRYESLIGFSVG